MKAYPITRIIATVLLGLFVGYYIHADYEKWSHLGRDAFSIYQMQRFDRYMATPQPILITIAGGIFVAVAFVGVYELIALALSAIHRVISPNGGKSQ
jgi:hypothetical protein